MRKAETFMIAIHSAGKYILGLIKVFLYNAFTMLLANTLQAYTLSHAVLVIFAEYLRREYFYGMKT